MVVSLIFSAGYYLGVKGYSLDLSKPANVKISREIPPNEQSVDFAMFWKVWDTLQSQYFDKSKIKPDAMVYGAIQGMVSALGDPYTSFLPPQENKVVEEDLSGSFEGVGIQIGFKGVQLAVMAPLPGSPAEKAGIKAGDLIVGIKDDSKKLDTSTTGMNLEDAVKAIRGPAGSKVTLALTREGQKDLITVDVIRAKMDVPTLILTYVGDNKDIADIQLQKFGGETKTEWDKAVSEIVKNKNVDRVILDLRNNPGGYLDEAVDITSDFVKTSTVAVIEEKANGDKNEYKTTRLGLLTNMPVVVLINKGSASASEILAGALRDDKKVKLIGDTSFGKGTIQEPQQLDNGAGLHITIAKWLTPSGVWVNEKGLEPDVKIVDDPKTTEDEQLQKAIEVVKSLQ